MNEQATPIEVIEIVRLLTRAVEQAPLPKRGHIQCEQAARRAIAFLESLADAEEEVSDGA